MSLTNKLNIKKIEDNLWTLTSKIYMIYFNDKRPSY